MGSVSKLTSCMLALVGAAAAQTGQSTHYERLLPQWLTGIIAVCGFLLLTFIAALVKKVWCESSSGANHNVVSARDNDYVEPNPYERNLDHLRPRTSLDPGNNDTKMDILRSRESSHIYDNFVHDGSEDKSTAM